MKTKAIFMAALIALGWSASAYAEDTADRLQALEDEVRKMKESRSIMDGLTIGGYGELHYNNLNGRGGADDIDLIDFHRFVLFFGYDFTDRIRLRTELELEHSLSGDGKPGEVELEQAYIDFDLDARNTARAGLFLLPLGFLNQTHEPPLFYGVERNPIEKDIIPSTWWEAGAGLHGQLGGGLSYEAYLHSGLNTSTNSGYAVRSGRQKVAKAEASDLAGTLALNYRIPGLTVGGGLQYQEDITQSLDPDADSAWLGEVHAELQKGPAALRALYAEWKLDGAGPESVGADRQYGWFVEPSYRLTEAVGLFARYSEWDNTAGDGASESEKTQMNAGVNWWPHEQVVVKADYQWQDNENGKDQNGVNLGLGYVF